LRENKWLRSCLDGRDDEVTDLEHVFGGSPGDETALLLFYAVEGGSLAAQVADVLKRPISAAKTAVRNSVKKVAEQAAPSEPAKSSIAPKSAPAAAPAPPAAAGGGGCCIVS